MQSKQKLTRDSKSDPLLSVFYFSLSLSQRRLFAASRYDFGVHIEKKLTNSSHYLRKKNLLYFTKQFYRNPATISRLVIRRGQRENSLLFFNVFNLVFSFFSIYHQKLRQLTNSLFSIFLSE